MTAIVQFDKVESDKVSTLSFSIDAGEIRILQVLSQEAKTAVIDMSLCELLPAKGHILLQGQPLETSRPGSIGWVPAAGGLISNLKVWENITLPLWYHNNRQPVITEESVARWLSAVGMKEQNWEKFMASPVAQLNQYERKLAGLLRGLMQSPQLLVIDADLFDEVDKSKTASWISALERFSQEADNRAVLVVANASTTLPWKIIE
jgi:phospholipid/cholesterol/gamma-HCH transport system ATP-binding protein